MNGRACRDCTGMVKGDGAGKGDMPYDAIFQNDPRGGFFEMGVYGKSIKSK